MYVAVLSDIHSNLFGLEAVLKDIKKYNISHIIVAGDHIGDGPQPKEVLERVFELNASLIQGNREDYMIKYHNGTEPEWKFYDQMSAVVWTYNRLQKSDIKKIASLPEQIVVKLPNTDPIRVVHGSPFSMYEALYPDKNPEIIEKTLECVEEPVLICGHSHQQWTKKYDKKLIANPGSVGLHFNENKCAEYALLKWENHQWEVELKEVYYDLHELENMFINSGLLEECAIWAKSIIMGIKRGRDISIEFLRFAYNLAKEEGYEDISYVPNDIWKKADSMWNWNEN